MKCPCRHWRDKRHHQNDVQWSVCETNWISTVVASWQKIIIQHNVSCMIITARAFPLGSACYGCAQDLRSITSRLNGATLGHKRLCMHLDPISASVLPGLAILSLILYLSTRDERGGFSCVRGAWLNLRVLSSRCGKINPSYLNQHERTRRVCYSLTVERRHSAEHLSCVHRRHKSL